MQMKSEFEMLVNRLGLGEEDLNLARIVWTKCENTMQGKGQEAVLLGGEPTTFETRSTVVLHKIETITDAEIDFLVDFNRGILTSMEELKKLINRSIQVQWLKCDPDNPETLQHFDSLNEDKRLKRMVKRQSNTLASIQRKLKKAKGFN